MAHFIKLLTPSPAHDASGSPGDPFETKAGKHTVQVCQLDKLIDAIAKGSR